MKLPIANGECPYCHKKIPMYNEREYKYGSPIVHCAGCGEKYLDTRYHELACEGMPQSELNTRRYKLFALICLGISVVFGAGCWFYLKMTGRLVLELAFIAPISAIAALFNLIEYIRVKTGAKQKRLEAYA